MAAAQDSIETVPDVCYRARPLPRCKAVFLTNFGGYVTPNSVSEGATRFRVNADWGLLVNTNPRDAFGASLFLTLDEDELTSGAAVRYRRWLDADRSIDFAVGTPLSSGDLKPGSVLAIVKYNPQHWLGVAVRPEFARRERFTCGPGPCTSRIVETGRVYVGVEAGWWPGLTLSTAGGLGIVLLALLLAGAD